MLYWDLRGVEESPELMRGEPPPGLLSAPEQVFLRRLKLPKRRAEWILGRYASKCLALAFLQRERQLSIEPSRLTVAQAPDGAPYLILAGEGPLPYTLRISHRAGRALVAIAPGFERAIGVDLELIEPRAPSFVETFFTEGEARSIREASPGERDRMVTEIWSLKESALKAVKMGLRADTRWVEARAAAESSPILIRTPLQLRIPGRPVRSGEGFVASNERFILSMTELDLSDAEPPSRLCEGGFVITS